MKKIIEWFFGIWGYKLYSTKDERVITLVSRIEDVAKFVEKHFPEYRVYRARPRRKAQEATE